MLNRPTVVASCEEFTMGSLSSYCLYSLFSAIDDGAAIDSSGAVGGGGAAVAPGPSFQIISPGLDRVDLRFDIGWRLVEPDAALPGCALRADDGAAAATEKIQSSLKQL